MWPFDIKPDADRHVIEAGTDCERCGHPFDPHAMVATTDDPLDGGVILCPVKDCECYATWSARSATPPTRVPDRFELARIREHIQEDS